ncbi:MAG: CPBP family intramembrane metalloprotease [Deltaproteobacteria bacterium]|nr:MAG: CPBP family intramembrane metalloprotease [Deltaproteobacteria bacterium]
MTESTPPLNPPNIAEDPINQPQDDGTWDMGDFFLLFLVQHTCSFLLYGVLTSFVTEPGKEALRYFMVSATLISNAVLVAFYVIRARLVKRFSWDDLGWRWTTLHNTLYWSVVFFVMVFLFNYVYQALLTYFELGRLTQEIASFFGPDQPFALKALTLFLVVVGAPLAEELLYRGVLFTAMKRVLSPHTAAIAAGLIFGAIHFELRTIIPLGFLGYLLCLTYHYTRSLWLCIALHTLNNALAFAFLLML